MKRNTYRLSNIDCANCALKIEDGIGKLDGVSSSSLNYMVSKLFVSFDESVVSDEEIEKCIHKSLAGVRIVQKNNGDYEDNYEEPKMFKKIVFRGRNK